MLIDIKTKDIIERNNLIVKLYQEGKKYTYTGKNNEGDYIIIYEEEKN